MIGQSAERKLCKVTKMHFFAILLAKKIDFLFCLPYTINRQRRLIVCSENGSGHNDQTLFTVLERMDAMNKEGFQGNRIPSGCAISGIFSRSGRRIDGVEIIKSIALMHERSNGLGGGFAGYGIYPEYKDLYSFHVFYYHQSAKEECERFL